MKKDEVIEISQEEAIKVVQALPCKTIHCFIDFIGADWDKTNVINLIKSSKRIAWADEMFAHNLAVIANGRLHRFDIQYSPR